MILHSSSPISNSSEGSSEREPFQPQSKQFIKKEGVVIESFPDARFRVRLDEGEEVLAQISGKMRMYKIRILPGDRVTVEFSPYDLKKGRIVYRSK